MYSTVQHCSTVLQYSAVQYIYIIKVNRYSAVKVYNSEYRAMLVNLCGLDLLTIKRVDIFLSPYILLSFTNRHREWPKLTKPVCV